MIFCLFHVLFLALQGAEVDSIYTLCNVPLFCPQYLCSQLILLSSKNKKKKSYLLIICNILTGAPQVIRTPLFIIFIFCNTSSLLHYLRFKASFPAISVMKTLLLKEEIGKVMLQQEQEMLQTLGSDCGKGDMGVGTQILGV